MRLTGLVGKSELNGTAAQIIGESESGRWSCKIIPSKDLYNLKSENLEVVAADRSCVSC